MKTPTDAHAITETTRVRLPIKTLLAVLAAAVAVGVWIARQEAAHDALDRRVKAVEERTDFMWGRR